MTNENRNSLIVFLGLLMIIIYVVNGILNFFDGCVDQSKKQAEENPGICYDFDDDNDNDEEQEDIEEEEPLVQCPPSHPITSYELFRYNINILTKPSFWMLNG